MLPATLSQVRSVSLLGLTPKWTIQENKDVVYDANGAAYVRIASVNTGLNALCSVGLPSSALLSQRIGLNALIDQRNQKQAQELSADTCNLFDGAPRAKRSRTDRGKQQAMRSDPTTINIEVDVLGEMHEVSVLRLVHPCDNLFVAYTEDSIAPVLHHLREQGFNEYKGRPRNPEKPKGVWEMDGGFVVKFQKADGLAGYKKTPSLDAAKAFLADMAEHGAMVAESEEGGLDDDGDRCGEDNDP